MGGRVQFVGRFGAKPMQRTSETPAARAAVGRRRQRLVVYQTLAMAAGARERPRGASLFSQQQASFSVTTTWLRGAADTIRAGDIPSRASTDAPRHSSDGHQGPPRSVSE